MDDTRIYQNGIMGWLLGQKEINYLIPEVLKVKEIELYCILFPGNNNPVAGGKIKSFEGIIFRTVLFPISNELSIK
jgi:hypothetical protein